ncbi:actin family [Panaeolus papilionaceus]|nr:actin family [Panaeolus papilionaceus]
MEDELAALVIDNGTGTCKAGCEIGDDGPRSVFPPIVGCERRNGIVETDIDGIWSFVGDDAQTRGDILTLKYPVERGYVKDWDAMERVWNHAIHNQLRASMDQHPLLLTETPLNPKASREKAAQIMFETFRVPALSVALQPTLCLYNSRFRTSVVLGCGEGVTHATAFYEGSALVHSTIRLDFSGSDLTDLLHKSLGDGGHLSITREQVETVKHDFCYVSLNSEGDTHPDSRATDHAYKLPDGQEIVLGDERYMSLIPEALFRPTAFGVLSIGLHELIHSCIKKCDPDLEHNLRRKVVLTGGTTMFPGFVDRLCKELDADAASDIRTKVIAPTERRYSTWIGGSILASLSTFQRLWCTRGEYDEVGAGIIHRSKLCFIVIQSMADHDHISRAECI